MTGSPDENCWLLRERLKHARHMPSDRTHKTRHNYIKQRRQLEQCKFNLRVNVSVWKHDSRASGLVSAVVSVGGIHCIGNVFWCDTICLVAHRQRVVQRVVALREYARAPDVACLVKGKLGAGLVEPDSVGRPRVLRESPK